MALEWAGRALLLASSTYFITTLGRYWWVERRWSTLALLLEEGLILWLILARRPARALSPRGGEWMVALLGSILPTWLRSYGQADAWGPLALQLGGTAIAFAGLASLNRSFGIVPADRGVKTGGMYRAVRHPIYAGYGLSYTGYCLNHPSLYNACLTAGCVGLFALRILFEERLLDESAAYADYRSATRWRLVPGIW